jgi:fermentation-respiration switch protein FrsA (DUF1100 family)
MNHRHERGLRLVLLVAVGVVAALGTALAMNPLERLIFHPERQMAWTPRHLGLSYEDAAITTADNVRLHGWYVAGRRRETMLWLHGNAGNISHRVEILRLLHDALGVGLLIVDYRGYGQSEGSPSEAGLYEDARAALAYLRRRPDVDPARLVYFGQSLGSAVALNLAVEDPPFRLILENPFTSIRAMARALFPAPFALLAPSVFNNLSKIERLRTPLLVIHGDRDEVVPFEQGKQLFAAAPEPKTFYEIHNAGHNDTYLVGGEEYFERIEKFLEEPPE